MIINNDELKKAKKVLARERFNLLNKENVVAVGIGFKERGGEKTNVLAIICSVNSKQNISTLAEEDIVPDNIQGVDTDVKSVGTISALDADISRTQRNRPAPGGVSVGHYNITAGTLGCYVRKNGIPCILSNNHVLANSNNASIGDGILQPGSHDGGKMKTDMIAKLTEFVPIEFMGVDCPISNFVTKTLNFLAKIMGSGVTLEAKRKQPLEENYADCAIAEVLDLQDMDQEILGIGEVQGIKEVELGMPLIKSGRTTGVTTGTVDQIDVTVNVGFGGGKMAIFTDQVITGPISQPGDSGSLILTDNDHKALGLLFAGSNSITIFSKIQHVKILLNIEF